MTAKQCSFGPLDLPPKFLPIAFLQLFDLAFTCFFNCCLRNCCHDGDTGPQRGNLHRRRRMLIAIGLLP